MTTRLVTTIAALCLSLGGCVTTWTWSGGEPATLQFNHRDCIKKAHDQAPYIPAVAMLFGAWKVRETLYKDCMEGRGYALEGARDSWLATH